MVLFYLLTSILLTHISYVSGHRILAAVGDDDVKLPFNASCGDRETLELFHWMRDATARLVASNTGGEFAPGPLYAGRLNRSDPLLLNNVGMNDNGLYEQRCGGRDAARSELLVGPPVEVSAPVGQAVDLPCHSVTLGVSVQSVVWKKGGEVVFELHENFTPGKELLGSRVSVRGDWMQQGDLSLRLEMVDEPHGGDYFCLINDDSVRSLAAVVRLKVRPSIPDPETTATCPTPQKPPEASSCWSTGVIIAVAIAITLILILLMLLMFLGYRLKRKRCRATSSQDQNDENENTYRMHRTQGEAEECLSSSGSDLKLQGLMGKEKTTLRSSGSL